MSREFLRCPEFLRCLLIVGATLVGLASGEASAQGLAAKYPGDKGLAADPAVLYFLDFNDQAKTASWTKGKKGYGWTKASANVFAGGGALEISQTKGTHYPMEIHPKLKETDVAYVRWYRKWEKGYDFTQHKMPGVYAKAPGVGGGGAGIKPNGRDKYSCKLYVDFKRYPRFYTYHPEQKGRYGDGLHMNIASPKIQVQAERWYCFEMMIKANKSPKRDGELKMWIDGKLVGHYKNMRFRDVDTLKINQFTYSAYVGGTWTSKRNQKLWDDQIVVASKYIGCMASGAPPSDAGLGKDASLVVDAGAISDQRVAADVGVLADGAAADAAAGDGSRTRSGASDGCSISGHPPSGLVWLLLLLGLHHRAARRVRAKRRT